MHRTRIFAVYCHIRTEEEAYLKLILAWRSGWKAGSQLTSLLGGWRIRHEWEECVMCSCTLSEYSGTHLVRTHEMRTLDKQGVCGCPKHPVCPLNQDTSLIRHPPLSDEVLLYRIM